MRSGNDGGHRGQSEVVGAHNGDPGSLGTVRNGASQFYQPGREGGHQIAGGDVTAGGSVTLHTRWCSGIPTPHYAQTRFKGSDANGEPVVISGPWVRLLSP